jgi:hypothetical protein
MQFPLGSISGVAKKPMNEQPVIVVNRYTGSQVKATKAYQIDGVNMAIQGYFPISQSWSPGEWEA